MSDLPPKRDYGRSRAVVIGAWAYRNLPPVPAARNSLERMAGVLTGDLCQWPADRVEVVRNPRERGTLPNRLMGLYEDVKDVALFYFVGHGQLHGDQLCLALRDSPREGARRLTTGLAFADVRAALHECEAKTKIVILDCCFSGHATLAEHTLAGAADVITMTTGTGAFTMAASGAFSTAWYEPVESADPQTYFTKYLVDVIERGLPGHDGGIALGPLFTATADALARDRKPVPTRSVRDYADQFVIARNIVAEVGAGFDRLPAFATDTTGPAPSTPPADGGRRSLPWLGIDISARRARRTLAVSGTALAVAGTAVAAALLTGGPGSPNSEPALEIGVQGPLTGTDSVLGDNIDNGVKLAVAQANAKGDLPFKLTVKEADDQGGKTATEAANRLIQDPGVLGVIGPALSAEAASAPLYSKADLAAVSPSISERLTGAGYTSLFRLAPPLDPTTQGGAAAAYIAGASDGIEVYVIDDATLDDQTMAAVAREKMTKLAGASILQDSEPQPGIDYESLARKVVASHATALLYIGSRGGGSALAKALVTAGYNGSKLASYTAGNLPGEDPNAPGFSTYAEGWQFMSPTAEAAGGLVDSAFDTAYQAMTQRLPGGYALEGYDAANTLIAVMKGIGAHPTRAQVLSALRSVDYQGSSKRIRFTPDGDVADAKFYVYAVVNGRFIRTGTTPVVHG